MIREVEASVGHYVESSPEPVKPGKGMCNCSVFVVGRFVVLPIERSPGWQSWVDCLVNCAESTRKWKVVRIEVGWKNPSVTLVNAYKDAWNWIHDRELRIGEKKTHGGYLPELLHPLYNCWIPFVDLNAFDEDIEAFRNKSRSEVGQCWHRRKKFEGRQADTLFQRCLKYPRNAPRVQHSRSLVQSTDSSRTCATNPAGHPTGKSDERFDRCPDEFISIDDQMKRKGENVDDQVDDFFLPTPQLTPHVPRERIEAPGVVD